MSDWISVFQPPYDKELEIAYFDGTCMCRCFGAYTDEGWFSGKWKIEDDFKVMYWKYPTELPEIKSDKEFIEAFDYLHESS